MWHDNESKKDFLGYERYARAICLLAEQRNLLPTTIGLFGDWGSGKSSILGIVEEHFNGKGGALCMRFDGWLFEGYDDARAALMTEIISSIKQRKSETAGFGEKAGKLLRRVDWFRVAGLAAKGIMTLASPFSSASALAMAITKAPEIAKSLLEKPDETLDKLKELIKPEENQLFENVREFRMEFESLVSESGLSPFVILIDDLDRCLPESIISTLEAIKLFLSVPGTTFVIAADERIVRHAISRRYPVEQYREQDLPQDYLEKLIQIPIKIPPLTETEVSCYMYLLFAERALRKDNPEYLEKLRLTAQENRKKRNLPEPLNYGIAQSVIDEKAKDLQTEFSIVERISPALSRGLDGNPRLIKRFLNTFSLRLTMAEAIGLKLKPDNLAKMMVLEQFHEARFRELYEWQLSQDGLPDQIIRLEDAADSGKEEGLKDAEKVWLLEDSVRGWLLTEPRLSNVPLSEYFSVARETLRISTKGGRQLPPELQTLVADLQSKSEAVRKSSANRVVSLNKEDMEATYDALLVRAINNPQGTALLGMIEISYLHEDTMLKFLVECKRLDPASLKGEIVLKIAGLKNKFSKYTDVVDALLKGWKDCAKLDVAKAAAKALQPSPITKGKI